ncbi:M20/M25/M40 family metallo-hydrolase, partial [Acinetobacter baumannii]|uniref:M20/M25/M40 family metallo-hydrolase n=1 Tax=Acinetobacter baumannii TaxID=470 RepID=UPI001111D786
GQKWTSDPYALRRTDGRLYGRGTCDMKGFDAIALAMIPAFLAAERPVPTHILLSYDEEVTCLGPVDLIARFGKDLPRPRAVIGGEPTMMQVVDGIGWAHLMRTYGLDEDDSERLAELTGAPSTDALREMISDNVKGQIGYALPDVAAPIYMLHAR